MQKENYLKEKIEAGKAVIGTFSIVPSTVLTDIISLSGMDFVIIDSEHGPVNFETAQNMVITCESRNISPALRVSGLNEGEILKALDIGVHCLHIPNIKSVNEAKLAVAYSKYPPAGNRGFSPYTRAGNYGQNNAHKLTDTANRNTLLALHIEGAQSIKNLEEIIKIKEVDIIFVGLFDLSKSLGIPGDIENPRVLSLLQKAADKTLQAGKYPGTIATNESQLAKFIQMGVKYITYSVDCDIIAESFKNINAIFRKLTK